MTENVIGITLGVAIFGIAYWVTSNKRPAPVTETPTQNPIGFVHFKGDPA